MPECPECGNQINSLVIVMRKYVSDIVQLKNGDLEMLDDPEETDNELAHYECPSCSEMLFSKTSDAKIFLGGNNE